ncbi:MAG: efflux RND transporter periplasmic adaptor subunit [Pirellulaceae bacterium]
MCKRTGEFCRLSLFVCILALPTARTAGQESSFEIDGFTEPFRTIAVATAETGVVVALEVSPGDVVAEGQLLARLDSDIHEALLEIARQTMHSRGKIESARAEYDLRLQRMKKFEALRAKGHARQEELERARADVAIAEAQVRAAEEEMLVRQLEYEKAKALLERRSIRAPSAGVVTEVRKEAGEIVAPNDPQILTLVQLDPLLAAFPVPIRQIGKLGVGDKVSVRMLRSRKQVEGVIHFVSPVINAESGTIQIKVRIENPRGRIHSGERCALEPSAK